jgi:hypothetical protein
VAIHFVNLRYLILIHDIKIDKSLRHIHCTVKEVATIDLHFNTLNNKWKLLSNTWKSVILALKGKRDGFPGSCSLYLIVERNTSGFHDVCTTLPSGLSRPLGKEIILVSIKFGNTHNAHFFYIKPLTP